MDRKPFPTGRKGMACFFPADRSEAFCGRQNRMEERGQVMMKAGIYCRLSEEDRNKQSEDDDSNSIQNQKALLLEYAVKQGWEVYNIYSDDDYTGADRKRPQFNRLLADAEQGRFQIVLCKSQSRFTRELELVEKYLHGLFPQWGIRFVSIADNADTANRGNKKSRQINGLVNEWYLEDLSDNIKVVLTNRRQNGYHIGAFALYGYKKDPERKGHLIVDEEAAAVVREVFTLFAQGYGKTAIARRLNDRGIPNPTEYKRIQGLRYQQPKQKNSTLWKYFAISNMLTNELYIGNMVQGKYGSVSYKTKQNKPRPKDQWYRVEGTHEPIIDKALWDRVQALAAQRAKPFAAGEIGLFARKVRCGGCGYTMRSSKNAKGLRYLQCSNRHVAKDACGGAFISVDRLERYVMTELDRLTGEYLDWDQLEQGVTFRDDLAARRAKTQAELAACEKRGQEYEKGLRDLYFDKTRGILTEEDYLAFSQEFSAQRQRLKLAVLACEDALLKMEAEQAAGEDRQEQLERYIRPQRLNRQMVDVFIDTIYVGKRIPGSREVPVEIHWTF